MAIKASSTITLASVTDIDAVTPYYYQQTATILTPPSKPTTNPPANTWSSAQPVFDYEKDLYMCFLNEYSDGTWDYSDVSKSADYEAAKQAYNLANTVNQYALRLGDTVEGHTSQINLKIDKVTSAESTSLISSINAIADQIILAASQINFTSNISVADELGKINSAVAIDTVNSTIRIGDPNDFNVFIEANKLSFRRGEIVIAYLSGQELYITQSVVLEKMDVGRLFGEPDPLDPLNANKFGKGKWSWEVHPNGETPSRNNLNLKWIG